MKKIFTIGAFALAALAVLSCNKEVSVDILPSASVKQIEIRATRDGNDTKTSIQANGKTVFWSMDDQISVFDSDTQDAGYYFYIKGKNDLSYTPAATATFVGQELSTEGSPTYYAVYPYNRFNTRSADEQGTYLRIPFASAQHAVPNNFSTFELYGNEACAYSAVAKSQNTDFTFKNVFGLLALQVADDNVVRIEIKGNSSSDKFGAYYIVRFDNNGNPVCTMEESGAVDVISLTPKADTKTTNYILKGYTYYVAVPPMTFASGATFTLKDVTGATIGEVSTAGAVSITRGSVHEVNLPQLVETPDNGDGTLANPFSIAGVKDYIDNLNGSESADVYVKGRVTSVVQAFASLYGNANFYIADAQSSGEVFQAYRIKFLNNQLWVEGNSQIQVGDDVILCGKVQAYTGADSGVIYETKPNEAYVYSLNGVTSEVVAEAPVFSPEAGAVDSGTQVSISSATEGASIYYSYGDAAPETLYTGPITVTEAVKINALARKEGYKDSPVVSASYSLKGTYQFTTVAELNAQVTSTSTSLSGKLTGAVVSFVGDAKSAIIKDATGSIMYYKNGHGLKQGQTFSGDITVKAVLYNSLYSEITEMDATFQGDETPVDPEQVTLASIAADYSTYQNAYVMVSGLEVTAVSGKNITVTDGSVEYIVYTNYGNATVNVGEEITAIGTVTKYSTTEEIKVWKADDITVDKTVFVPASIEASDISGVSADGVSNASKSITIKNGDGWSSNVTCDGSVVTAASLSESTITYSVSKNTTSSERKGSITITLSYSGQSDVVKVINVGQLAAGASDPVLFYTLDGTITGGSNGYATESDITQSDVTWKVTGNTTMSPWRIGGKNLTGEDRPLYSTQPLSDDAGIVVLDFAGATLTVNSVSLIVSKKSDFSAPVANITKTDFANDSEMTFNRPSEDSWKDCYFKFVFNVTTSGSSNQYVQLKSIKFYSVNATK